VIPHVPETSPTRGTGTTDGTIVIDIAEVLEDGGSPILSYSIEMDDGSGYASIIGDPDDSLARTHSESGVTSGASLKFKYRVRNVYGWSDYSPEVTIIASTESTEPLNPASTNTPLSSVVTITWDLPTNTGGDGITIDEYRVLIRHADGVTFSEPAGYDGTNATLVSTRTLEVEMATLHAIPFYLTQADDVIVKVQARNVIGWSAESAENSSPDIALVEEVPHKPQASPRRDYELSTDSLMQVEWDALDNPENGGAQILSYQLQYDDASAGSIWTNVIGFSDDSVLLTAGVSDSIQVGKTYLFRYRGKNVHGWGPYSDSLSLIAAQVADTPDEVVTSNEATFVRITWTEPAYNGGTPLLGFRVLIKSKAGDFVEDTDNCDGHDQTTKANLFCLIPMQVLRDDYLLVQGDDVIATVEALNAIGYSDPSADNTVIADVRTEPLAPPNPVARVDEGTTDTQIKVSFENLSAPDNGGSTTTSLNLYWDQGVSNWVPAVGEPPFLSLDQTFTVKLLYPGSEYKFKYRAVNLFGEGAFSAESTVTAATNPDQIEPVTTSIVGSNVRISWEIPNQRGSTITSYTIYIADANGDNAEDVSCDGTDS